METTKVEGVKAKDIPPIFGKEDRWSVQDEYGNIYKMSRNPNNIYLKRDGDNMELHLVYSTSRAEQLKGAEAEEAKKENPF